MERVVTKKDIGSLTYLDTFLLSDVVYSTDEGMKNRTSYTPNKMFQ